MKTRFILSILITALFSIFIGSALAGYFDAPILPFSICLFAFAMIPQKTDVAYNNIMPGATSPNRKIVQVGNSFSPSNLRTANQQASTRNVYDYIKLSTSTVPQTLSFFKNVAQKTFPFTNINENRFAAGESLAVMRAYFSIIQCTINTTEVVGVIGLDKIAAYNRLYRSDMNFFIDNNRVIKDLSITSFKGEFNSKSNWGTLDATTKADDSVYEGEATNQVFSLDDAIVIPEQISFRADLTIPQFTLPFAGTLDSYLGLTLEGFAALVSPKTKF